MAKNRGGKKGKHERKARADERQALRERGCQQAGCKSLETVIFYHQDVYPVRLCQEHGVKRGYCVTCHRKRATLENGTCAACWMEIRLGIAQEQASA